MLQRLNVAGAFLLKGLIFKRNQNDHRNPGGLPASWLLFSFGTRRIFAACAKVGIWMSAGFPWTQNPFQAVSIGLVEASTRRTQEDTGSARTSQMASMVLQTQGAKHECEG